MLGRQSDVIYRLLFSLSFLPTLHSVYFLVIILLIPLALTFHLIVFSHLLIAQIIDATLGIILIVSIFALVKPDVDGT